MAKLYPPLIEGILPAFTSEIITQEREIDGLNYTTVSKRTNLTIAFEHNPSIVKTETKGMQLYMVAAQDNSLIATEAFYWPSVKNEKDEITYIAPEDSVTFELTGYQYKLIIGNHYKVQIAYINANDEIGYYSTVGIVKYTTSPSVIINHLGDTKFQSIVVQEWIDESNEEQLYSYYDTTEKLYSVTFELYKAKPYGDVWVADEFLATSGGILHNTNNDIGKEQIDEYDFGYYVDTDQTFICKVIGTTVNALSFTATKTINIEVVEYKSDILTKEYDRENGSTILRLHQGDLEIPYVDGKIYRTEIREGNEQEPLFWDTIANLTDYYGHYFYDCTGEYGKNYAYRADLTLKINPEPDAVIPHLRVNWNEVSQVYFDDAFLYDGEKQLCIKYNPQMNSIKDTVLETKVDTIGGKYPYIYRNGMVKYKEFPIGGLISYTMDKDGYFTGKVSAAAGSRTGTPEVGNNFWSQDFSTNLTDENVKRELNFKLEVLEWLNNGKPKLFRSPTEGNYLVRLMNVSLSPTKEVGRMLHSFTATAYEIDDHDLKTLKKYGIIGG